MMTSKRNAVLIGAAVSACLFLAGSPSGVWAAPLSKGSLSGYVYQSDGTTPARGAVVVLKNLANGATYESEPSSEIGYFKLEKLDRGLYMFGAVTEQGEFNGRDIIGIERDTTARLSIALEVQAETRTEPRSPNEPPAIRGERFVGRVTKFDPTTMEVQIFVEQGELRPGDNMHFFGDKEKGSETDFYQKARKILLNGSAVDKAVAGQYYILLLEKPALERDWLYIKEKSGLGAFFLTPIGMATVLASSTGIVITVINPPPEVSVYRH